MGQMVEKWCESLLMALLTNKDTDGGAAFAANFHFPTSKKALLIFTRNPELGKCKTRLAKSIGAASALEIYKLLLQHTVAITKGLKTDKFVFYSETIWKEDIWKLETFRKKLQRGEELGARMENAFADIFEMGYEKAIIIGSDMYDLNQWDLEEAFSTLETRDFVIGPAEDGGYYLLGMKQLNGSIFRNKQWGTQTVLKDTLKDLEKENIVQLKERNDIDTYDDITNEPIFQQFVRKDSIL
jgi:rSAM/selenodomain-associated transferase 1